METVIFSETGIRVSKAVQPDFVICQSFSQFEEFQQATHGWDLDFIQLAPAPGDYLLEQFAAGPMLYSRARLGAPFRQYGGSPPGCRTFTFLASGSAEFRWCKDLIGSDTMLVMPESGEFESVSSAGLDTFHLSLSFELLEWASQQQMGRSFGELLGPERRLFRHAGARLARLRYLLQRMSVRLADPVASHDAWLDPSCANELALLVVDVLASGTPSSPRLPRGRRERAIFRALDYLDGQSGFEFSVTDLVREAGVSRRTLESAFQDTLGTSPAAYLKAARLHRLRTELRQTASGSATVAELASALGFKHGGQMAADYAELFGERPSATLRR